MACIEKTAKSVEEAIKLALDELKVTRENATVEILEQPSKGLFGFGSKLARVRVEAIYSDNQTANKFLVDVLNNMNIKAEIKITLEDNKMYINLIGPKMGMIIGRRGQTLDSLQYLVSLVVNKNSDKENYIKVILDTEDYRRKREETLERLAERMAIKVLKLGRRVELEPMNPYERRIIHASLQDYPGVTTYSEGEEPYRKVIISKK